MIRKSLKRFAAVLCAAVTMVSFSSTRVEAADGDGYWTPFEVKSFWSNWYNPARQYVHNRLETVGNGGFNARAKVNVYFDSYSLYDYEADVRFIYFRDEYGNEEYHNKPVYQRNLQPGSYEFNYYCNRGAYYLYIRPEYKARITEHEFPVDVVGIWAIKY